MEESNDESSFFEDDCQPQCFDDVVLGALVELERILLHPSDALGDRGAMGERDVEDERIAACHHSQLCCQDSESDSDGILERWEGQDADRSDNDFADALLGSLHKISIEPSTTETSGFSMTTFQSMTEMGDYALAGIHDDDFGRWDNRHHEAHFDKSVVSLMLQSEPSVAMTRHPSGRSNSTSARSLLDTREQKTPLKRAGSGRREERRRRKHALQHFLEKEVSVDPPKFNSLRNVFKLAIQDFAAAGATGKAQGESKTSVSTASSTG